MSKLRNTYDLENLGVESLVGLKVENAFINSSKDYVRLDTNQGSYFLTWVGNCCAHCFLAQVSGASNLIGATIISAENAKWSSQIQLDPSRELSDVFQTMGTNIITNRGHVTLESRVEHNGYYSGNVIVSKVCPVDSYGCGRDVSEESMFLLEDF